MLKPPSSEHILGTDKIGRDVFARIIYGGRISILVGLGSALGAALIGVSIGAYTAYRGGWWDSIFLRISEIFMAFPQIILVLLLVSVFVLHFSLPDTLRSTMLFKKFPKLVPQASKMRSQM